MNNAQVFLFCFFFIGMPIGMILGMRVSAKILANASKFSIKHIPKLAKNDSPLVVDEFPKFSVFLVLCLKECKLLVKELLLKIVSKFRCKQNS